MAVLERADDVRFLTLTIVSTDRPLTDQITDLRTAFKKLRRSRAWKLHVNGGVTIFETTWNAKTQQWHPHLHVLIDGTYWDRDAIRREWQRCHAQGGFVKINRVHGRENISRYVAKYVSKSDSMPDLPLTRFVEWACAVHGLRTHQTFGCLHGHDRIEKPPRPSCGWIPVGNLNWLVEAADHGDESARILLTRIGHAIAHTGTRGLATSDADEMADVNALARSVACWIDHHGRHSHDDPIGPHPPRRIIPPPIKHEPTLWGDA
jgi:hypothetical protein